MKAFLKYDLKDTDDKLDFETCLKASDYKLSLEDIANNLFRKKRKYDKPRKYTIEELEKEFYEILESREVNLFD